MNKISTGETQAVPEPRETAANEFEGTAREDAHFFLDLLIGCIIVGVSLETPEGG